jgi:hypothetical protein
MKKTINLKTDTLETNKLKKHIRGEKSLASKAILNPHLDIAGLVYLNRYVDITLSPIVKNNLNISFIKKLSDCSYCGDFFRFCSSYKILNMIISGTDFDCNYRHGISPRLTRENFTRINYSKYINWDCFYEIGNNPHLSDEMVRLLLTMEGETLKKNLARNPHINSELLEPLIEQTALVRKYLASRVDLPEKIMIKLTYDKVHSVVKILAERKDLTTKVARELILQGYHIGSEQALNNLYEQDKRFAGVIIKQPSCSDELKLLIINEQQQDLLSLSKLKKMLFHESNQSEQAIDISTIKTGKELMSLYKNNRDLGYQIVKNPNCTKPLLKKLLNDNWDISFNPKVQLELLADEMAIKPYIDKRNANMVNLAQTSSCSAVHSYLLKHKQRYHTELGLNVNISNGIRKELFLEGELTSLSSKGIDLKTAVKFFERELEDDPAYMILIFRCFYQNYTLTNEQLSKYLLRITTAIINDNYWQQYSEWKQQVYFDDADINKFTALIKIFLLDKDIEELAEVFKQMPEEVIEEIKKDIEPTFIDALMMK